MLLGSHTALHCRPIALQMAESSLDQQLMQAAAEGSADKINTLIGEGAETSYQDDEGTSPLMRAAENGHLDAVVALLEAGAPWNQQDNEGYCAGKQRLKMRTATEAWCL